MYCMCCMPCIGVFAPTIKSPHVHTSSYINLKHSLKILANMDLGTEPLPTRWSFCHQKEFRKQLYWRAKSLLIKNYLYQVLIKTIAWYTFSYPFLYVPNFYKRHNKIVLFNIAAYIFCLIRYVGTYVQKGLGEDGHVWQVLSLTRGRCYDHNFLRFLTMFGEKIGVFLKNRWYDQIFA
jgi:hypothetical protein